MGLQMSCVYHHGRLLAVLGRQPRHDPGEDTPVAPTLPAVVERLVRPVFPWRISPPQAITIDEDNPAQDTPVINPGLAVRLGEVRLQTRHLRIAQPEKIRHVQANLSDACGKGKVGDVLVTRQAHFSVRRSLVQRTG